MESRRKVGASQGERARIRTASTPRLAALVLGGLPALAFPEANISWLAFIALTPALALVRASSSAREAITRGWLSGVGFMLATHYWLVPNLTAFAIPLAGFLALLWIPWAFLTWHLLSGSPSPRQILTATAVVPSAWVLMEVARSWQSLGGPFALLGSSQWSTPRVLELAAVGGVWLVSFVVVAVNVALVGASRGRPDARMTAAAVALLALGAGPIATALASDARSAGTLQIAGVQPGVVHDARARFSAEVRHTLGLAGRRLDLVVWGETSVGGLGLPDGSPQHDALRDAARTLGAPLLVNVDARRGAGGIFKSSVLVDEDGTRARYDKIRLVPFGEYIPMRGIFGWLNLVTRAANEDRRRGRALRVFDIDGARVGPLVCFESAFPDLARRLTRMGADVVIVQSATTTFQQSWAPAQHASLAAIRAMETGRPVVHATLSGVSAAFDARGKRLAWYPTDRTGVWSAAVPLARRTTLYVRYGDIVPATSAALTALALVAGALDVRRRRSPPR